MSTLLPVSNLKIHSCLCHAPLSTHLANLNLGTTCHNQTRYSARRATRARALRSQVPRAQSALLGPSRRQPLPRAWYAVISHLTTCPLFSLTSRPHRHLTSFNHSPSQNCPAGEYQSQKVSSTCIACEAGSYQSKNGSTTCDVTSNGTYTSATGMKEALVCPAGSFSGRGSTSCTK